MNLASEATWPSTVVGFGIDLAVKSTAILMIVLLLQALVGRRCAYLGAAIGNAGLIALLLLPASALIFPPVAIAWRSTESAPAQPPSVVSFPPTASHDAAPSSPRPATAPIPSAARPVPASMQVESRPPAALPCLGSLDWAALAVALHLLGAMVLAVRLCRSVLAIARLRRSCERVHNIEWTNALESWRRHLEIGREVGLYRSPEVRVPLALGWLKPAVVLPESLVADTFRGHCDSVLIHELAHVRRGDYPWNLCLRLAQIFYWPQLLVWVLGRMIVSLRERACDDLCISKLGGPLAYRESLIAVAAEMTRRPRLALGLAMASTSKLGRRLAQINRSDGNHRCLPGRQVNVFIAMMTLLMASILGMVRLEPAEARVMTAEASQLVDQTGRVFHLQVVAADTGEPVADAEVRVWMGFRDEWRKADSQGRLDITHSTGPSDQHFEIDVLGKGRAMQRHHWGLDRTKPIPDGATVKLLKGETLGGIVQDEHGKPIAMATVLLWSHNYKKNDPHEILYDLRAVTGPDGRWQTSSAPETTGELLNVQVRHPHFLSHRDYTHDEGKPSIADLRAGTAVMVMKKGVPIEGRVVDADGKPVVGARIISTDSRFSLYQDVGRFEVSTGPDGRFRTDQVKPGEWAIVATAKGHAPALQRVEIVTETPFFEMRLGKPHSFKGRVVDTNGNPVAGAFVDIDTWREVRCLGALLWTDEDGRFRWGDAPDDELTINVSSRGYRGLSHQKTFASEDDVVLKLEPSLRIVGEVRDSVHKERVEAARVEYGAVDEAKGEPVVWVPMPQLGSSTGVYQGELDINFPISAESYQFRLKSPGYQTFVSRVFRSDEVEVWDYDVTLEPEADRGK